MSNIEIGDKVRPYGTWTLPAKTCGTVTEETEGSMTNRIYEGREPTTLTFSIVDPEHLPALRVVGMEGPFARLEPEDPFDEAGWFRMVRAHAKAQAGELEPEPQATVPVWPIAQLEKVD